MRPVPPVRLRAVRDEPLRPQGRYVLYWMTAARRPGSNFALQRAAGLAAELGRGLVVLEALGLGYPHASERFHAAILQGMAANRAAFEGGPAAYHAYVEPRRGAGRGLVKALARDACAVVADEDPHGSHPRMVAAAARQVRCRLEAVDGQGLLPLRAAPKAFTTAFSFRGFLQRELPAHLAQPPLVAPLRGLRLPRVRLPPGVARRWPMAGEDLLAASPRALAALPVSHRVGPVAGHRAGCEAGRARLRRFVRRGLGDYDEDREHPDLPGTSGLSPDLHFGHVGAHQVLAAVARAERWTPKQLGKPIGGKRRGWWRMARGAEAFLEQLATWRDLALNNAAHHRRNASYQALPGWARATLARHARDRREATYGVARFEAARTHDEVWNAAQRQLLEEGVVHNRMRMLWGKGFLAWSPTPQAGYRRALLLNDRWALDGRDANSVAGVAWCFGRYDRAWGPERKVYGTVRYMSTAAARRKVHLDRWLAAHAGDG